MVSNWRLRVTSAASHCWHSSVRGRRKRLRSSRRSSTAASSASMRASTASVLASRPMDLAKSRAWRGLSTATATPSARRGHPPPTPPPAAAPPPPAAPNRHGPVWPPQRRSDSPALGRFKDTSCATKARPIQAHSNISPGTNTMDFDFSDSQEQLRDAVRKWVDRGYSFERYRAGVAAGGFARQVWSELAELGLTALTVPEEYGGLGQGAIDAMVVAEELGRGLVLEPIAQAFIASAVLTRSAPAAVQSAWLPRVASGQALVVLAQQERKARY